MSIRQFIGASSTLLLVWLGVTFFHEVPVARYESKDAKTAELAPSSDLLENSDASFVISEN